MPSVWTRLWIRLVCLGLLAAGGTAKAVDMSLPVLHTTEEIRRMPSQQAERHYPVHLHGVITYFDQRTSTKAYRFIQDDTGGIYFYSGAEIAGQNFKEGQLVDLDGETGQGEFAPVVVAHAIHVLGEGKMPVARQPSFEALFSGQEDSQYVEINGIVHSVRRDAETSNYVLEVASGGGRVLAYAAKIPARDSEDLVDGTIVVRGVCITRFNQQRQLFDLGLMVSSDNGITIEQPAPFHPFAVPIEPIKNILQFKWRETYGHRVKVFGVVTYASDDTLYIQDQTQGLCVQTIRPAGVQVGDRVEALGFPAKGDYTPVLQSAICRQLPIGVPLEPQKISVDEALNGSYDCRLVSLEATVLDRAQQGQESFLTAQAGKTIFRASLRQANQNPGFISLENGSRILVSGICIINPGSDWHVGTDWRAQSFSILLRSPADVVILTRPPWWTLQRLLIVSGILCIAIMTAMGWVLLLRRRVRAQTKIIEEKLQAEAAIRARYVELFENANDVVFTHDRAGRITSINQTGALLLQRNQQDILNNNLVDFIVEEQRPAARQWLEQVVTGADLPMADWDFLNASGQRLKLEINSRRIEQTGRFIEVEGIARDATERKRLEREILEVASQEQQRLGHDLHDGVCQQLAAIAYRTHILERRLNTQGVADSTEAREIGQLINESLLQTRAVARGLYPVRLEAEGLVSALEEFTHSIADAYKVKCAFVSNTKAVRMNNTVAVHAYYIAQEAVINAVKHAQASQIDVTLKQLEKGILLEVQDNGIGFAPANCQPGGMGIGIMRYRAKVIGAALDLKSEPGHGTRISCKIS